MKPSDKIMQFMDMTLSNKLKVFGKDSFHLILEFMGICWELVVITILAGTRHMPLLIFILFSTVIFCEYEQIQQFFSITL
jgi:hypothetical protein